MMLFTLIYLLMMMEINENVTDVIRGVVFISLLFLMFYLPPLRCHSFVYKHLIRCFARIL